jgi:hypothetical protein
VTPTEVPNSSELGGIQLQLDPFTFLAEPPRSSGRRLVVQAGGVMKGFVFIPGRGGARFTLNTRSIYRGVEGQWFRDGQWHRVVNESLAQRSLRP